MITKGELDYILKVILPPDWWSGSVTELSVYDPSPVTDCYDIRLGTRISLPRRELAEASMRRGAAGVIDLLQEKIMGARPKWRGPATPFRKFWRPSRR